MSYTTLQIGYCEPSNFGDIFVIKQSRNSVTETYLKPQVANQQKKLRYLYVMNVKGVAISADISVTAATAATDRQTILHPSSVTNVSDYKK